MAMIATGSAGNVFERIKSMSLSTARLSSDGAFRTLLMMLITEGAADTRNATGSAADIIIATARNDLARFVLDDRTDLSSKKKNAGPSDELQDQWMRSADVIDKQTDS